MKRDIDGNLRQGVEEEYNFCHKYPRFSGMPANEDYGPYRGQKNHLGISVYGDFYNENIPDNESFCDEMNDYILENKELCTSSEKKRKCRNRNV